MANFSYADYQNVVAQAQANSNGDGTKVGYFRLKEDGDIAIARINIASTDELEFAAVHTISTGGRWLKVSCHNPLSMNGCSCALCAANAANPKGAISKASKKVYIPMMVSYRDTNAATGYTAPAPVIWERPAGFSRELANKLMIAGDLRNTLVLITRNGKAGDMQTTYSMDILPEAHPVFKPDMIPVDFSAFNNFNIARHSYWEKTNEEIQAYLATGQFPERTQASGQQVVNTVAHVETSANTTAGFQATTIATTPVANMGSNMAPGAFNQYSAATTPQVATTAPTAPVTSSNAAPARNFAGFSF